MKASEHLHNIPFKDTPASLGKSHRKTIQPWMFILALFMHRCFHLKFSKCKNEGLNPENSPHRRGGMASGYWLLNVKFWLFSLQLYFTKLNYISGYEHDIFHGYINWQHNPLRITWLIISTCQSLSVTIRFFLCLIPPVTCR